MAARTLAQLQAAVQAMGFGTDTAAMQTIWLNDEYRKLAGGSRWDWLESRFTFPTVAGQAAYTPSPTDIRNLDKLRLADAGGLDIDVDYRPSKWVQDHVHRFNQLSDRAAPQFWSTYGGQIYLYPIPDGVYTAQVDYTKNIVPMVAGTDTTIIPEAYDEILVWGAAAHGFIRQNNWLQRDTALGQATQLKNAMEAEYSKDQTQRSEEVEWSGMWSNGTNSYYYG